MEGSYSEEEDINVMVSKFISNKNLKIDIKKYRFCKQLDNKFVTVN